MHATALIGILLGALAAGPIAQTNAGSPDEIVARANELVAQGQYADAIKEYERAAELKPGAPEVAYNKGVALYRLGDFGGAAEAFGDSMSASKPWLDRRARYNLGNCAFAQALAKKDQDPQAAVEQLNTALGHYRDVLKADARDTAARANLERSQLLKDRLEEMLQQQQQQQSQQNNDENEDEQEESSENQDSKQNDEQQDQQQSEQDKQQQGEQQQQNEQQSEDGEQQQSEQDQRKESQQQQSDDQKQSQSQEQQGSEEGEKQEQADKQEPKEGDLKEAQEQQGEGNQQQEQEAKTSDNPPKDGKQMPGKPMRMSEEEAKKLLQMIRDKEQLRRAQLLRAKQEKQEPVAKDW